MVLTYISRGEYISGLRSLKCCWTKVKLSLLFPSPVRGLDLRVYLEESDGSFPQCESNFPNELFQKSLRRRIYSSMSTVRLECKNLPSHKRSFKRKRKAVRRATKFIVKSEEPYDVDISGLKLPSNRGVFYLMKFFCLRPSMVIWTVSIFGFLLSRGPALKKEICRWVRWFPKGVQQRA